MRIIRHQPADQAPAYAQPREDGQVNVLQGDFESGFTDTGEVVEMGRPLPPIAPVNIFCIGKNYQAHAAEFGMDVGEYPVVFMKPTTAIIGPGDVIRIPASQMDGPETDYEAELAIVIGKPARNVDQTQALEHVFGYACANDVSARKWQKQAGGNQWIRGKGFDTFCPVGPELVTADEIGDPQTLDIKLIRNGETMQSSNTSDMVFSVATIVSYLSRDVTLLPGTLILTGTPEGVGAARDPQVWLAPDDEVVVEIEKIGQLRNVVKSAQ